VVEAYIKDPLVYTGKITARLAAEILLPSIKPSPLPGGAQIPILIMQAVKTASPTRRGAEYIRESVLDG